MQIIPKFHPGADALNPAAAIDYAGHYLRRLYERFGSWELALAAYNWGEGNIARNAGNPAAWPKETRDYVANITQGLVLVA
jgi:soluble lytic murein transglycosylase-like protein